MQIRLPDFALAYDDVPAQKPDRREVILLIHGYPLSRAIWKPQLEGLSEAGRVIAPDLRGFGGSQATPGPYGMDLLADDCAALLDGLGIRQPVIVGGLSMGGYVALAFYRKYPGRVGGLILAATRAVADSPEARDGRDKAAALAQKEGSTAIARAMLPKMLSPKTFQTRPELVAQVKSIMESASVTGIVGALQGMRARPDSSALLAKITQPALLLFGEDDQFVPRPEIDAMHAAIRGSQLHILLDAGHLLTLEQPERFNQAVKAFLKTVF